jgi:hypothetical protein
MRFDGHTVAEAHRTRGRSEPVAPGRRHIAIPCCMRRSWYASDFMLLSRRRSRTELG